MKANVGMIDRLARFAIGLVLIVLTLMQVIGVWGWIGVIPMLTAAVSFCPLYSMLKISTRHESEDHHHTHEH